MNIRQISVLERVPDAVPWQQLCDTYVGALMQLIVLAWF
jgi:hypothetical protein